jgi:hypothetical protein
VFFLSTFDANGDLDVFRNDAKDKETGVIIPLPGPGPMFIVGTYAYLQLFVIDPRVSGLYHGLQVRCGWL